METFIYLFWILISTLLAWKLKKAFKVYLVSSLLASIPVCYSQICHGLIEMAGFFHVLTAGLYPLILFYVFRHILLASKKGKIHSPTE